MRAYSNIAIAKFFLGSASIIWMLALIMIAVNHSLSCVNHLGCLNSMCDFNLLKPEYQAIILNNAKKCPFQNTTILINN